MDSRRSACVFACSLMIVGLGLATRSSGDATDPKWVARPVALCRYEIDIRGMETPHGKLARAWPDIEQVCPFIAGRQAEVTAFVAHDGSSCDPPPRSIRATSVKAISIREYDRQKFKCDALLADAAPAHLGSRGKVYVVRVPLDAPPGYDDAPNQRIQTAFVQAVQREGLPFRYAQGWMENETHYFCFEMMPGADSDPLADLRAASVPLLERATEQRSSEPNCILAARANGVELPQWGRMTTPQHFEIRLRGSTAAPAGDAFLSAVSRGLSAAGFVADTKEASYDIVQRSRGTVIATMMVVADDGMSVPGFRIITDNLSQSVCRALYAAMSSADAFVASDGDEPGAILPASIKGGQPRPSEPFFPTITRVHDGKELCVALRPAFDGWIADRGSRDQDARTAR
jgi:hypothetical protein